MAQEPAARPDREIDVVGKACPLPLVLLAKTARELRSGQVIRITGNDPIFEASIVEFCRERQHAILETERRGRTASILIRL